MHQIGDRRPCRSAAEPSKRALRRHKEEFGDSGGKDGAAETRTTLAVRGATTQRGTNQGNSENGYMERGKRRLPMIQNDGSGAYTGMDGETASERDLQQRCG